MITPTIARANDSLIEKAATLQKQAFITNVTMKCYGSYEPRLQGKRKQRTKNCPAVFYKPTKK